MSSPHTRHDIAALDVEALSDAALQELIGHALKSYAARREEGVQIHPFASEQLNATEIIMVATDLLEAGELELVDLSIWRGLGIKPSAGGAHAQ
ncbi:hypothetical protein GH740_01565 [Microbacterium sp. SYP-A9085]|uniref:hypothetical protein n=1 Tax=Microbacterium sp. SYP-A9085 TaxID=2664454 RepID=UPI00129AAE05|nr:hypothetical protein [Microbacterium sp. SYP-A9085]MRH28002.1 hypothetical protein [Microbacterium sp. SYP-A9085]